MFFLQFCGFVLLGYQASEAANMRETETGCERLVTGRTLATQGEWLLTTREGAFENLQPWQSKAVFVLGKQASSITGAEDSPG